MSGISTAAVKVESPINKLNKQIQTGRLGFSDFGRAMRASNSILRENNALTNSHAKVVKSASGNAEVFLRINRNLNSTYVTMAQRLRYGVMATRALGKQMIATGKNIQWAGRQVMIGLTLPLLALGRAATNAAEEYDKQLTRIVKVTDLTRVKIQDSMGQMTRVYDLENRKLLEIAIRSIERQAERLVDIGAGMGFMANETSKLVAEFSQMGFAGFALDALSESALRLARVSGTDLADAMTLTRLTAQAFGKTLGGEDDPNSVIGAFAKLNIIENQTSLSLSEMAGAIPIVAGVAKNLSIEIEMLGGMLAIMKDKGIDAREGATSLRTGLIRLVQDATAPAIAAFDKLGINIQEIQQQNMGDVFATLNRLAQELHRFQNMGEDSARATEMFIAAIGKMVGTRAAARFTSLLEGIGDSLEKNEEGLWQFKEGVDTTSDAYRALSPAINDANNALKQFRFEEERVNKSLAGTSEILRAQLNVELRRFGRQLLPLRNAIMEFAVRMARAFNSISESSRRMVFAFAGVLGTLGPATMIFGVLTNAFGQLLTLMTRLLPSMKLATAQSVAETKAFEANATAVSISNSAKQSAIGVNSAFVASSNSVTAALAAQNAALLGSVIPGAGKGAALLGAGAFTGGRGLAAGRAQRTTIARHTRLEQIRRRELGMSDMKTTGPVTATYLGGPNKTERTGQIIFNPEAGGFNWMTQRGTPSKSLINPDDILEVKDAATGDVWDVAGQAAILLAALSAPGGAVRGLDRYRSSHPGGIEDLLRVLGVADPGRAISGESTFRAMISPKNLVSMLGENANIEELLARPAGGRSFAADIRKEFVRSAEEAFQLEKSKGSKVSREVFMRGYLSRNTVEDAVIKVAQKSEATAGLPQTIRELAGLETRLRAKDVVTLTKAQHADLTSKGVQIGRSFNMEELEKAARSAGLSAFDERRAIEKLAETGELQRISRETLTPAQLRSEAQAYARRQAESEFRQGQISRGEVDTRTRALTPEWAKEEQVTKQTRKGPVTKTVQTAQARAAQRAEAMRAGKQVFLGKEAARTPFQKGISAGRTAALAPLFLTLVAPIKLVTVGFKTMLTSIFGLIPALKALHASVLIASGLGMGAIGKGKKGADILGRTKVGRKFMEGYKASRASSLAHGPIRGERMRAAGHGLANVGKAGLKKVPGVHRMVTGAKAMKAGYAATGIKGALSASGGFAMGAAAAAVLPIVITLFGAALANPEDMKERLQEALSGPIATIKNAWDGLTSSVRRLFESIRAGSDSTSGFGDALRQILAVIIQLSAAIVGGFLSSLIGAVTFVVNMFQGFVELIKGSGDGLGIMKNAFTELKGVLLGVVASILEALANIPFVGKAIAPLANMTRNWADEAQRAAEEFNRIPNIIAASRKDLRKVTEDIDKLNQAQEDLLLDLGYISINQYGERIAGEMIEFGILQEGFIEKAEQFVISQQKGISQSTRGAEAALQSEIARLNNMTELTDEQKVQFAMYLANAQIRVRMEALQQENARVIQALTNNQVQAQGYVNDELIKGVQIRQVEADLASAIARKDDDGIRAANRKLRQLRFQNDNIVSIADLEEMRVRMAEELLGFATELAGVQERVERSFRGLARVNQENLDLMEALNDELQEAENNANAFVNALKGAVGEVLSDVQKALQNITKRQEDLINAYFASMTDAANEYFDSIAKNFTDITDQIMESIEEQYGLETALIDDIADQKIQAIEEEMEAERKLEAERERFFRREQARIDFLSNRRVTDLKIQEAIASGNIGEAAVLQIERQAAARSYRMQAIEDRQKELAEMREAARREEMERIDEQRNIDKFELEQRKAVAEEAVAYSRDAFSIRVDEARDAARREIEIAESAARDRQEAWQIEIDNYIREWQRITPATAEEQKQRLEMLKSFLDQQEQLLLQDLQTIENNLSQNLAAVSSQFSDVSQDLVQELGYQLDSTQFYTQSMIAQLTMAMSQTLISALSMVEGFNGALANGLVNAEALVQEFARIFLRELSDAFSWAMRLAESILAEEAKWREFGERVAEAFTKPIENKIKELEERIKWAAAQVDAQAVKAFDWKGLSGQLGSWGAPLDMNDPWGRNIVIPPRGSGPVAPKIIGPTANAMDIFRSIERSASGITPMQPAFRNPGIDPFRMTVRTDDPTPTKRGMFDGFRFIKRPERVDYDPTSHLDLVANRLGIPGRAEGGIVARPHIGLVGEAGPEVIIPLSKIGDVVNSINEKQFSVPSSRMAMSAPRASQASNAEYTYELNFNINGGNIDEHKLAQKVVFEIKKMDRGMGGGRRMA